MGVGIIDMWARACCYQGLLACFNLDMLFLSEHLFLFFVLVVFYE